MASVDPIHVLRGSFGEVQSLSFLTEDRLYTGDSNGELRLWDLATCRPEFSGRLHDTHAGLLHLVCPPAYGTLISQGRDGCVKLWAAGRTGALDRPQPICEIRTESFNFCRCALWAPDPRGFAGALGTAGPQDASGRLQDLRLACAAHDPADVDIWRPAEVPTAVAHLRQAPSETKHGMCMSLVFLSVSAEQPPAPSMSSQPGPEAGSQATAGEASCSCAAEHESTGLGGATGSRTSGDGCAGSAEEGLDMAASGLSRSLSDCAGRGAKASSSSGNAGTCPGVTGGGDDPRFIVTGYEDGMVSLWDLRSTGRPLGSLRVHREPVMCLDAHQARPAGRRRAGAAAPGPSPSADAASSSGCGGGGVTGAFDLVSGSADDQISCCLVRPAEAQPLVLSKQTKLREAGTADVRIRPDGKLFACGCWDGRVRLYSMRRKEPLAVLKYHRGQVTAVAFSPLTHTLATASRDTTVALWSVYAAGSAAGGASAVDGPGAFQR